MRIFAAAGLGQCPLGLLLDTWEDGSVSVLSGRRV